MLPRAASEEGLLWHLIPLEAPNPAPHLEKNLPSLESGVLKERQKNSCEGGEREGGARTPRREMPSPCNSARHPHGHQPPCPLRLPGAQRVHSDLMRPAGDLHICSSCHRPATHTSFSPQPHRSGTEPMATRGGKNNQPLLYPTDLTAFGSAGTHTPVSSPQAICHESLPWVPFFLIPTMVWPRPTYA